MSNEWDVIIEASDKIVKHSTNLFTYVTEPRRKADEFLYSIISEKGEINDEDLKKATLMLHVHKLHKRLKNYYKIIQESEVAIKKDTTAKTTIPNDDWLDYFEEVSSKVSNDTLQKIWARLLTKERLNKGSVSKVMLNTFSLLDKKSTLAFAKLCCLTYEMKITSFNSRTQYIPLVLSSKVTSSIIQEHEELGHYEKELSYLEEYQAYLPTKEEMEYLSELNLIKLNQKCDEEILYSSKPMNIVLSIKGVPFQTLSIDDSIRIGRFLTTGEVYFTQIGLNLYNALSMEPNPLLFEVLKDYISFTTIDIWNKKNK